MYRSPLGFGDSVMLGRFHGDIFLLCDRCWSANAAERPSMSEVVRIMSRVFQVGCYQVVLIEEHMHIYIYMFM